MPRETKTMILPLSDRVVVRRIEADEMTKSGLYVPDIAKEKPQQGEAVYIGEGRIRDDGTLEPMKIKEGDRVLFGKYSGAEVLLNGEKMVVMRQDDVLAIVIEGVVE